MLQIALLPVLGFDNPVVWNVITPLRNGFFFLPHPQDASRRVSIHDMLSLCQYARDTLRRGGERSTLVSYDPQVVRGIKICTPGLGTVMISGTGNVRSPLSASGVST